MLFNLAAWVVILFVAWVVGRGVLALLRVGPLRPGDAFIIGTWLGIVVLALTLLGVSLVAPLSPAVASSVAVVLTALGMSARKRGRQSVPASGNRGNRFAVARALPLAGITVLAIGAAALTSDAVTLYDSLVYHIGIVRWLREHGTVPGVALIHNRLGHVSAWFALAAPFDAGVATSRAATVPLGVTLMLVGAQTAIAAGRAVARRACVADFFTIVIAAPLIWAVTARGAATPSPDVPANVLMVVAAWSMLVVSQRDPRFVESRGSTSGRLLIPLLIALGASAMKLFALPGAVVAALLFIARDGHVRAGRSLGRPVLIATLATVITLGPFVAANLTASGCPAYPSPIGCTQRSWSVGRAAAGDYAGYIRDVARWDRRGNIPPNDSIGWIAPWVGSHPVVTLLSILSPVIAIVLLRHAWRDSARHRLRPDVSAPLAVVGLACAGIAFAAWQAPAPRFLFAVALLVPALAAAYWLHAAVGVSVGPARPTPRSLRFDVGFAGAAMTVGLAYGVASQKLNIRSPLVQGTPFVRFAPDELLLPAAPAAQPRLYRWRVNDLDVLTPVPRPVADTLGYQSVIAHNAEFEKCSTAPLPCTPYLPGRDVRLRRPELGPAGGFVRVSEPDLAGRVAECVGELSASAAAGRSSALTALDDRHDASACVVPDAR
jgi:hypothetical protein